MMKQQMKNYFFTKEKRKRWLKNILYLVAILALATLAAAFDHQFRRINIVSTYILAIVIIARITDGYIWGIVASLFSVLCVNYLFTYPYFSFDFTLDGYPITFLIMSATALLVNITTVELKQHAQDALRKEKNTQELYFVMKDLVAVTTNEQAISITISHFKNFFHTNVIFHRPEEVRHKTGLDGQWYYLSLDSPSEYYGTLAIDITPIKMEPNEFSRFVELITARTLTVLESLRLKEIQKQTMIESEREKMRSNLLRAVSHDLRTPLTTMLGSTTTLMDNQNILDNDTKMKLLSGIRDDCEWLIHMVENLLSVTRIREGDTKLKTTLEPAEEIIAEAVTKLKKRCPNTEFHVKIPEELLMVPMDATLIEQVIINLCENSVHHSGCPSPIDITLSRSENNAVFQIRDYGRGLCPEQLDHLFDGYTSYSSQSQDSYKGMGIGLSICMTIIKAHNGTIRGYNNNTEKQGGACFEFSLPMEEFNYE